jgi:hypothetical protein
LTTNLALRYETTPGVTPSSSTWIDQASGDNATITSVEPYDAGYWFGGGSNGGYMTAGGCTTLNSANAVSFFAVFASQHTAEYSALFAGSNGGAVDQWCLGLSGSTNTIYVQGRMPGWTDVHTAFTDNQPGSKFHIVAGVINGTDSTLNGNDARTISGYLDGGMFGSVTGASAWSNGASTGIGIGCAFNGTTAVDGAYKGTIAAVLAYNTALSPSQVHDVAQYLHDTYNTAALVPEPTGLMLLCTGLIGLLAYAWRKR